MLELYGEYTNLVEKGPLVDVDIAVSNDLSIKFDFGITYNKKTGAVSIKGLKGVPEMSLNKKEIQISKNK